MIKFVLKLLDKAEQCLVVLNKIYQLLLVLTEKSSIQALSIPARGAREDAALSENPIKGGKAYTEQELLTVKEAMSELHISRWKLSEMRNSQQLSTIYRGKKGVRLVKEEVEAAKLWYSIPKGKC